MNVQPFVLKPDQREAALNVVGTQVTVLASNAATQSYGITLQQGEKGTGSSQYSHDWDESYYDLICSERRDSLPLRRESLRLHWWDSRAHSPRNRAWLSLRTWRWSNARDYGTWRVSGSDVHGHRPGDPLRTAGCSKAARCAQAQ